MVVWWEALSSFQLGLPHLFPTIGCPLCAVSLMSLSADMAQRPEYWWSTGTTLVILPGGVTNLFSQ